MRGWSTLALVVVFAGLVGYIYFVDSKQEPGGSTVKEKPFGSLQADDIEEVQVKSADGETTRLQKTDGKWQDYLPFCDRLYFAVAADFPREIIPATVGLLLADRYGAELVRDPVEERLSAARRKAIMLSFAHAAAFRLQLHLDPSCGFEL